MTRIQLGWFIQRTWRKPWPRDGQTLCAAKHRIYPTRNAAVEALIVGECSGYFDDRFDHDVAEVWMRLDGEL